MPETPDDALLIRPARPEDALLAAALLRASITQLCINDHGHDAQILQRWAGGKTPENVLRMFAEPGNHPLVAERAGQLVGVCMINDAGEVLLNYVAPQARFSGVSKAMLAAMESLARQRYLTGLQLNSTVTARSFYLSGGFKELEEVRIWRGVNVHPMYKALSIAEGDDGR